MPDYRDLKEECWQANLELPKLGLVIHTFGNVSVVDRNNAVFAIKPSGVAYDLLKAEDIVIVDYENNIVEGKMRPSSDTSTHGYLYQQWETIGGIAHTHATYSVAWAQAQQDIPIFGTTHADHLTRDIPCAPPMEDHYIRGDYELMTGHQIVDYFKERDLDYQEVEMVLVGSHGPFTWGSNAEKAVYHSMILEELARMACITLQINPAAPRLKETLIQKHYYRKHGENAYYGQEKNKKHDRSE